MSLRLIFTYAIFAIIYILTVLYDLGMFFYNYIVFGALYSSVYSLVIKVLAIIVVVALIYIGYRKWRLIQKVKDIKVIGKDLVINTNLLRYRNWLIGLGVLGIVHGLALLFSKVSICLEGLRGVLVPTSILGLLFYISFALVQINYCIRILGLLRKAGLI